MSKYDIQIYCVTIWRLGMDFKIKTELYENRELKNRKNGPHYASLGVHDIIY